MSSLITTYTGKNVNPLDLRVDDICLSDIAHPLSMTCRFGGHCSKFYSVAEHSVLVSRLCPKEFALIGLLHDAAEAYLGDIPSPVKRLVPEFLEAEKRAEAVIALKFGIPQLMNHQVKVADSLALEIEKGKLLKGFPRIEGSKRIRCLSPAQARDKFLARFTELTGGRSLSYYD